MTSLDASLLCQPDGVRHLQHGSWIEPGIEPGSLGSNTIAKNSRNRTDSSRVRTQVVGAGKIENLRSVRARFEPRSLELEFFTTRRSQNKSRSDRLAETWFEPPTYRTQSMGCSIEPAFAVLRHSTWTTKIDEALQSANFSLLLLSIPFQGRLIFKYIIGGSEEVAAAQIAKGAFLAQEL